MFNAPFLFLALDTKSRAQKLLLLLSQLLYFLLFHGWWLAIFTALMVRFLLKIFLNKTVYLNEVSIKKRLFNSLLLGIVLMSVTLLEMGNIDRNFKKRFTGIKAGSGRRTYWMQCINFFLKTLFRSRFS